MVGLELAVVISGVVAWSYVLGARGPARSVFRVVLESIAVQTVVSTLASVVLVSGGLFRVTTAQAVATAVPIAVLLRPPGGPGVRARGAPLITRYEKVAVLLLVLVSPVALPRMQPLAMVADAGVYTTRAIHHLYRGSVNGTIPVRDRLDGGLLEAFDRDNTRTAPTVDGKGSRRLYLPGTYVTAPSSEYRFQFYPAWPMVMAQWAGIFGLARIFTAVAFVFVLGSLLFAFLLEDTGLGLPGFATVLALFVSSPLLLYFSKYTTSEAFLLFLFFFVFYFVAWGSAAGTALAIAGFAVLVATHVSTFLYAPLVFLVAVHAHRSADRRLAAFAATAFVVLIGGLALGLWLSPDYVRDIFSVSFRMLPVEHRIRWGLGLVVVAYAAGLGLAAGVLWRRRGGAAADVDVRWPESRPMRAGIWALLGAILVGTIYQGYQLGWTDRYLPSHPGPGAFSARIGYAGGGWSALAHLNVVSMVMAGSLVGLPLVLALAASRADRVCAAPRRCFLLCSVLLCLGIYTFVRPDTPVNYYASRYFIPVFVPSVMLLLGELVEVLRPRRTVLAIVGVVGLGFNLVFDLALYRHPFQDDQMRFVESVASHVGDHRTLFIRNPLRNNRIALELLAIPLSVVHDIGVVNVVGSEEVPVDRLIAAYADHLRLRDAAVISRRPPGDGREFQAEYVARWRFRPTTLYPRDAVERVDRYYVYNVAFDGPKVTPTGTDDR